MSSVKPTVWAERKHMQNSGPAGCGVEKSASQTAGLIHVSNAQGGCPGRCFQLRRPSCRAAARRTTDLSYTCILARKHRFIDDLNNLLPLTEADPPSSKDRCKRSAFVCFRMADLKATAETYVSRHKQHSEEHSIEYQLSFFSRT
jgi:hypothetical protein